MEAASGYGTTCFELGCRETATHWILAVSTHAPVMCAEHAAAWKKENAGIMRAPPEPHDPGEDHLAELDAMRARLHAAEDVCYQVKSMLEDRVGNLDVRIPLLRSALRRWSTSTRGL